MKIQDELEVAEPDDELAGETLIVWNNRKPSIFPYIVLYENWLSHSNNFMDIMLTFWNVLVMYNQLMNTQSSSNIHYQRTLCKSFSRKDDHPK